MKKGKCFSLVNRGQRLKSDKYQTPYSMTHQLLNHEGFYGSILEPACGKRAIVDILHDRGFTPAFYDIADNPKQDFLKERVKFYNIITNPPFSLAKEFIQKAKELYRDKIAFLLPLSYLHGQERYKLNIFDELGRIYVFTRYPMLTEKIRKDGKYNTGMVAYAWYIWQKGYNLDPVIRWIDNNQYVLRKSKLKKKSK